MDWWKSFGALTCLFANLRQVEQHVTSKEKILKKVRQALNNKSKTQFQNIDLESSIYARPEEESLAETFVKRFTDAGGKFVFCDNQFDCVDKLIDLIEMRKWKYLFCWEEEVKTLLDDSGISYQHGKENLEKAQAAISGCEALIARTGSILISSIRNSKTLSAWAPVQVFIVRRSQLVTDMKDGLLVLRNRYGKKTPSMFSLISGPSFSEEIPGANPGELPEKVPGGLGPEELIMFFIDDTKHD